MICVVVSRDVRRCGCADVVPVRPVHAVRVRWRVAQVSVRVVNTSMPVQRVPSFVCLVESQVVTASMRMAMAMLRRPSPRWSARATACTGHVMDHVRIHHSLHFAIFS